jgi:hypothetical protein
VAKSKPLANTLSDANNIIVEKNIFFIVFLR